MVVVVVRSRSVAWQLRGIGMRAVEVAVWNAWRAGEANVLVAFGVASSSEVTTFFFFLCFGGELREFSVKSKNRNDGDGDGQCTQQQLQRLRGS